MIKRFEYLFIPLLISGMFFILASWDMKSSYYGGLEDSYFFYDEAENIVKGDRPNPLSLKGVFDYHPVLDSYYQAGVMKLAGTGVVGWKFSGVLAASVCLFLFYLFLSNAFNKRVAMAGMMLLAVSHYLLAMGHWGYNNVHALLPIILSLYLLTKARQSDKLIYYFLVGITAGLSLYTFMAAMVILLIIGWYGLMMLKINWMKLGLFLLGFLWLFIPYILINREVLINEAWKQTYIGRNGGALNSINFLTYTIETTRINLFGLFIKSDEAHHYVSGSLIDPVTSFLTITGLGIMLINKRWREFIFYTGSMLVIIFICGGLFYAKEVAITRMFVALPFICASAGFAWDKLINLIKNKTIWQLSIMFGVCFAVTFLNLKRFYIETPKIQYQVPEVKVLGTIIENRDKLSNEEMNNYKKSSGLLQKALEVYKVY